MFAAGLATTKPQTLMIGHAVPMTGIWAVGPLMAAAIVPSIKEVERRQLLPGYHIDWVLGDTACDAGRCWGASVFLEGGKHFR